MSYGVESNMGDPVVFSDSQFRELIGTIANNSNNVTSTANLSGENLETPTNKAGSSIRITNFFGNVNEDIDMWLFAFKNWQIASGITKESTLIAIAVNHLSKNALSWFQAWATKVENPYSDWQVFEKALTERFNTGHKKKKLRDQIHYLRQKNSAAQYAEEFLNLKTSIGTMSEEEALDRFIRNLKPHIRASVMIHDPSDLLTAMKMAETFDTSLYKNSNQTPWERRNFFDNNNISKDPNSMDIDLIDIRSLSRDKQKEECKRRGLYFYCKEGGHKLANCPIIAGKGQGKC
ncbi:hypothetical protein AYI69_g8408 [Smittium culicis]|uniref:Ty3 transposon capsid-like protein domain-containing protein n=1 Tax=Smittium culicis TaxID=133412 RepID=A0A1R1XJQ8_9FUNG|nr:hypothetical protein AYI69_g8408 [Smittium culicis]